MAIVDLATSSFILFTVIVRENIEVVEGVCSASLAEYFKELSYASKMYYYTHAHMLHDVNTFRERTSTCKYRSKRKVS